MSDIPKNDPIAESFLIHFTTKEEMRDWIFTYLDIDFPVGSIEPDSNSSPIEWLFDAYCAVRDNDGGKKPIFVVYSSRESYKTLSCAVFEVIAMVHFELTVAHMAAIEPQSKKAVQYITSFMKKIKPYLEYHNRGITSQNTRNISITNDAGEQAYLTIIICTMTGANSEHTSLMVIDEIDVVRFPQAYEEAKLIPGTLKGFMPITIMTSTRKFAFGLMQKEIDMAKENGYPVLHWNLLDITEKCQPDRHLPDEPKQKRFIAKDLPLKNIDHEEWSRKVVEEQVKYDEIDAYAGCATCKILPVCRTRLAHRPEKDIGGLYKPIEFVINQFAKISPEMAEAQLLCWKPTSIGLVYPRFNEEAGVGNVLTLEEAYEQFTGDKAPPHLYREDLVELFHQHGIPFYCGADWGFRHAFAIIVGAVLPSGDFWLFETLAITGLEFPDMMKYAMQIRDKYKPKKWFCDTAQPMFIKSFRKAKMPCKDFKKDVMGGISSIRGQIVDASNRRRLKVLKTEDNQFLINGFRNHHFKLDAQGIPTQEPDDEEFADVLDSLRYMGQNLFASKGNIKSPKPISDQELKLMQQRRAMYQTRPDKVGADFLSKQINKLASEGLGEATGKSSSGTVLWDFSDPSDGDS
jgi:hypothetical protein